MMQYTLVVGAPVVADGKTLGKVKRIIMHEGVANQFTVDPGLLGTERVVPVSDVTAATPDGIELSGDETAWKAYPAYDIERLLPPDADTRHESVEIAPQPELTGGARAPDHYVGAASTDAPAEDVTLGYASAVLSSNTTVLHNGIEHPLHGLILDMGRPVQILIEGKEPLAADAVRSFSSERIEA